MQGSLTTMTTYTDLKKTKATISSCYLISTYPKYIHSSVTKENVHLDNHSSIGVTNMAPAYIQSYNLNLSFVSSV